MPLLQTEKCTFTKLWNMIILSVPGEPHIGPMNHAIRDIQPTGLDAKFSSGIYLINKIDTKQNFLRWYLTGYQTIKYHNSVQCHDTVYICLFPFLRYIKYHWVCMVMQCKDYLFHVYRTRAFHSAYLAKVLSYILSFTGLKTWQLTHGIYFFTTLFKSSTRS